MKVVRYADRPDLLEIRFDALTAKTFPEYMNENEPGNLHTGGGSTPTSRLPGRLVDGDDLLAEAHAVSLPWDGTFDDLPSVGTRALCAA
jgi:hypothetical protein